MSFSTSPDNNLPFILLEFHNAKALFCLVKYKRNAAMCVFPKVENSKAWCDLNLTHIQVAFISGFENTLVAVSHRPQLPEGQNVKRVQVYGSFSKRAVNSWKKNDQFFFCSQFMNLHRGEKKVFLFSKVPHLASSAWCMPCFPSGYISAPALRNLKGKCLISQSRMLQMMRAAEETWWRGCETRHS